jgi:hypothetical protein
VETRDGSGLSFMAQPSRALAGVTRGFVEVYSSPPRMRRIFFTIESEKVKGFGIPSRSLLSSS